MTTAGGHGERLLREGGLAELQVHVAEVVRGSHPAGGDRVPKDALRLVLPPELDQQDAEVRGRLGMSQ